MPMKHIKTPVAQPYKKAKVKKSRGMRSGKGKMRY
jgi:hypothetical protein